MTVRGRVGSYWGAMLDPAEVFARGLAGDLRPSSAWLANAPSGWWRAAIQAQRWLADPKVGALEEPATLAALGADGGEGRGHAIDEHARAAWLASDRARLDAYAALAPTAGLARGWARLARGDAEGAAQVAEAEQRSSFPATRVEAASLRALAYADRGELGDARVLARRASRMARTEDLPQSQYLSNLVLARVRRLEGAPHLALRILHALAEVASSPWWPRLAWEQAIGGRAPSLPEDRAAAWAELLGAARAADLEAFASARTRLVDATRDWPRQAAELTVALALLDPRAPLDALPPPLRRFCEGEVHTTPPAMAGLCTAAEGVPAGVFVAVRPDGTARRVAGLAAPLAQRALGVRHEPLKPGRTQLAIGVLAAAGPAGLDREELFRRIYGFGFDAELHDGTFRTLQHRMRRWLGVRGEMEVDGDRLALRLVEPLLLADPRCEESLEDRMLRFLARAEHQSARDAAKELGVPLRTAQTALQSLTESGAVEGRRVGRRIEYRVEDTTFSEPTRWR